MLTANKILFFKEEGEGKTTFLAGNLATRSPKVSRTSCAARA